MPTILKIKIRSVDMWKSSMQT